MCLFSKPTEDLDLGDFVSSSEILRFLVRIWVLWIAMLCIKLYHIPDNKLPSMEDRGLADPVTILASPNPWPWSMTLTFNLGRATVVAQTRAKYQGQTPIDSKVRMKQTNGRTKTIDCITYPASVVGIIKRKYELNSIWWSKARKCLDVRGLGL